MKPDYKNWMPKGMILGVLTVSVLFLVLTYFTFYRTPLGKVFLALTVIFLLCSIWMYLMYRAFSYDGKRQMSKQIINGVSSYVSIPAGRCLFTRFS